MKRLIFTMLVVVIFPGLLLADEFTNVALKKPYTVNIGAWSPHQDPGDKLTDGIIATAKSSDKAWQSHSRKSHRTFVVDLGQYYEVNKITLGVLQETYSNIWIPVVISAAFSSDGDSWDVVGDTYYGSADTPKDAIARFVLEVETKSKPARYVAVRVPVDIWVYVDELEVFGRPTSVDQPLVTSKLDSIDFDVIEKAIANFANQEQYFNTPGEIMKISDAKAGGAQNVLLVYEQSNNHWKRSDALPYISYMSESFTPIDWFFDTFLFLGLTSGSGRSFAVSPYADRSDWLWWLDRVFEENHAFDACEKTVDMIGNIFAENDHKIKVIAMIPYPNEDGNHPFDPTKPGMLNPYVAGEVAAVNNRIETVEWYVEEFERRWQAADFKNLELVGFYWLSENLDSRQFDTKYVPQIGDYLRSKSYRFYWIPWFLAPGYDMSFELGFDATFLQPNYMFVSNSSKSRLTKAAAEAKRLGIGLEIEADPSILRNQVARERYYDYLRAAVTYGYDKDGLIAFYQDASVFSFAAISEYPEVREIYDKTYDFVNGNFQETFADE